MSPAGVGHSSTSLYRPPVDDNLKNGDPASVYKDKITVSNEVAGAKSIAQ